jgi:WD40 repeat protein
MKEGPSPPHASAAHAHGGPEHDIADLKSDEHGDPKGDADLLQFPTTQKLGRKDHTKVVSALALNPSSTHVLSGSHDCGSKLWDLGGKFYRSTT